MMKKTNPLEDTTYNFNKLFSRQIDILKQKFSNLIFSEVSFLFDVLCRSWWLFVLVFFLLHMACRHDIDEALAG